MVKCEAVLELGDDFGDNQCTLVCQLEKGHEGNHMETSGERHYRFEWRDDDRINNCSYCKFFCCLSASSYEEWEEKRKWCSENCVEKNYAKWELKEDGG